MMRHKIVFVCSVLFLFTIALFARDREGSIGFNKPTVLGQIVRMNINNVDIPLRNDGAVFEADGKPGYYPNGQTTLGFLFSGGFATSGYVNGQLRCSWITTASLLEEWTPGKWDTDPTDPLFKFYEVSSSDGKGSQAYIAWKDAVDLGADYVEENGVPGYQPDGDRPDMLGDKIVWAVINDNTVNTYPGGLGTQPMGLEVHQQVWAFARQDALGDVVFFRYRLMNRTDHDVDDLIFTVWEDPDLGGSIGYTDDLIGCDTVFAIPGGEVNSLGFIYNDGDDPAYGANPPAFGVDFFQGPVVESPGDTAYRYRGPFLGIDTLPDMKNLPMTSFMYYVQGGALLPDPRDPETARTYQEGGKDAEGNPLDPPAWGVGGTSTTDPRFIFSGDPVAGTGWRDNAPADKRFMVNCGPFQLAAGDTQDIVVAYVVAQGDNALGSVTKLRETDVTAQRAYDANFSIAGPPAPPKVTTRTFDKKVELIIDLFANGTYEYDQTDKLFNRQVFEALQVYQFQSSNTSDLVRGVENAKVIARYDVDDKYGDLFSRMPDGTVQKIWSAASNIDTTEFQNPSSAVIRLTIDADAFNNDQPLINNKKYYFGVTAHSLNVNNAELYTVTAKSDDWIVTGPADFLSSSRAAAFVTVIPGASEFSPFKGDSAQYSGTRSNHEGKVLVDAVEQDKLTGDEYEVTFSNDGNRWSLKNLTTGSIPFIVSATDTAYVENMPFQALIQDGQQAWNFPIVDGFSIQVYNVPNGLDTALTVIDETDTNNVVWLTGSKAYNTVATSTFDSSIAFIKSTNRANLSSGFTKDTYFPVKLVFETSDVSMAYHYRANWNLLTGFQQTFVSAYDISDPGNPVKLNIAYLNPAPTGTIDFSSGNEIIIFRSMYDEGGTRYSGAASGDQLFKDESYLIAQFSLVADSLKQANRMEIDVKPYYPNSDVDAYRFDTNSLFPTIDRRERKNLLDKVKIVPNPYFAYSTYETSYDLPQIKFIHLDKEATVRIFNLAGQLVKTLTKDSETNELTWDLRNESRLKISSGMYIAHIEVPGVGEKIIKFAVVQREDRIDRY